jgi:hypothetical protein
MNIRSLFFTIAIVMTLVFFASPSSKPVVAQAPTVVGPPFEIVATKPDPKYMEMTYCGAEDIYFTFEPATQYSPNNEYVLFYYLNNHKVIAHDEALVGNLTVVIDDTVSMPKARLTRTERGQGVWDIIVTTDMKKAYSACLGKLKTR